MLRIKLVLGMSALLGSASLYLDGLLDTDEHRRLEADRARAELDHQHARREVERLHLIVRLVGATEGR